MRESLLKPILLWHDTSKYQKAPKQVKIQIYHTLIRPQLEYASSAWSPWLKQDILELEKVQCRAVCFVHNNYWPLASVTQMTSALGWETLEVRHQKARLCMLFKTINGIIKVPFDHYKQQTSITISTRSSHDTNLSMPYSRTNIYKNSFFPRQSATGTICLHMPSHPHICILLKQP